MYVYDRLSGFERREVTIHNALKEIMGASKDRTAFPGYYEGAALSRAVRRDRPIELAVNVAPIRYTGHALVERDIANVVAGTDCGLGGGIHPELAWAKLKALADGAALASRRLWSA